MNKIQSAALGIGGALLLTAPSFKALYHATQLDPLPTEDPQIVEYQKLRDYLKPKKDQLSTVDETFFSKLEKVAQPSEEFVQAKEQWDMGNEYHNDRIIHALYLQNGFLIAGSLGLLGYTIANRKKLLPKKGDQQ